MHDPMRPRRLRNNAPLRKLVRETRIGVDSLVYPLFIVEGKSAREEIKAMPGQFRYTPDRVHEVIEEALEAGVSSFLLFGIPDRKSVV